jgi:hypothetical protein
MRQIAAAARIRAPSRRQRFSLLTWRLFGATARRGYGAFAAFRMAFRSPNSAVFINWCRLEMLVDECSKKTDRFVPNNQIDKTIFVDLIQPY